MCKGKGKFWLPWSTGFAYSNPTEAVGFFRAKKKILSTPSFEREVKAVLSRVVDLRHMK
jgi:hypothetical protein